MSPLTALTELLPPLAWLTLGVLLRVGAAMAVLPGLGERSVPVRVRLLASLALTAVIAPAAAPLIDMPDPTLASLARITATETVAGLAIGILADSRADGLTEVMCLPEWKSSLWLVSHVDLHRTPKVQAAVAALQGNDMAEA